MGTVANVVVSGTSIALSIDDTDVGYTEDGVAVEHTKEYMDIEADQSVDILGKKVVREICRVTVNVEEATLDNIKIAMGEENSISNDGSWKRLSFGGGSTEQEHELLFTGKAPGTSKTRKLHIYKAISVESIETSYKKGEKTLVPIVFQAIADTDKPAGRQYGYYEDEI